MHVNVTKVTMAHRSGTIGVRTNGHPGLRVPEDSVSKAKKRARAWMGLVLALLVFQSLMLVLTYQRICATTETPQERMRRHTVEAALEKALR